MSDCVDRNKALSAPKASTASPRPSKTRAFDASKYSTRYITLKFAYLGRKYNGLEYHKNNDTALPTVEEVLWNALSKSRLVSQQAGEEEDGREERSPIGSVKASDDTVWKGCDYSKCGRTDRGVSAFGQVVALRIRSARPKERDSEQERDANEQDLHEQGEGEDSSSSYAVSQPFDHIRDELPYIQILNRLLPSDLRILAWCPSPPSGFSARFSCKERRYKYFFTNPCFPPTPYSTSISPSKTSPEREGWLNIPAMQEAAAHFTGLHDFSNFCKIDASKQLTNYQRRIFHADISPVSPSDMPAASLTLPPFGPPPMPSSPSFQSPNNIDHRAPTAQDVSSAGHEPRLYAFTVHGSAFLWHQIRHMISILFLIGQGLESPSLVPTLLDTATVPRRPHYEMADETPLVLWDCIFPDNGVDQPTESQDDGLQWVWADDEGVRDGGERGRGSDKGREKKTNPNGLTPRLWEQWYQRKMDEVLAGGLLNVGVRGGRVASIDGKREGAGEADDGDNNTQSMATSTSASASTKVFLGGPAPKLVGKYVPMLQRDRMESPDATNAKWRAKQEAKGLVVKTAVDEGADE